ncbi:hypothetical protein [Actinocatenispora rupis]|uniref:Uncharacterized protein n=1 Tax=Actinocatenispora rupis TaxID=519421 RepID=A0A8J3NG45_9ACTN|nr:hypothetical protein [Actinocatenispora rupis]GID15997.1 hypothetical protein Aru02nite_68860 [Actinocatenispora rupis]
MATISVGSFVPVPGQVVYLTDKASPQFVNSPIRLLITANAEPSTVDERQGHTAVDSAWLALTGWELDQHGKRVRHRDHVAAYKDGIIVCGNPGVRRCGGGRDRAR